MDSLEARDELVALARAARASLDARGKGVSPERLAALLELGRALRALGDEGAPPLLREATDLAEALRHRAAGRLATIELGTWHLARGDAAVARGYLERALDGATAARDRDAARDVVLAAAELALARLARGERAGAEAALELARASLAGAPSLRARVFLRAADLSRALGESEAARASFGRALEAASSLTEPGAALERATVTLAAHEGLLRLGAERPGRRELALLPASDLAALVEAGLTLAEAPRAAVAARTVELALALSGASSARLLEGEGALASSGEAAPSHELVRVRRGERSLVLGWPPGRTPGPRESLLARVLLAQAAGIPVVETAAPPVSRILALLERVLEAGLDLERLDRVVTDLAVEATGAARGLVLLREPGARLGYRAARQGGGDLEDPAGVVSRSLVREAFLSGRALLLADAASDPERNRAASVGARGLRSVLVAPIPGAPGEPPLGLLYLDDPGTVGRFGAAERDLAVGFAARLGAPLRLVLEREREQKAAASARTALSTPSRRPATRRPFAAIVGRSRAIGAVLLLLDKAVDSNAPVLVSGESGTGKELVAQALHREGPRGAGPLEALSCAALADSVLESELFGHVAGAFTGARAAHQGAFERAHGGTLFLDELQEASPKLQAELLRVLETGEVRPVGASHVRRVDVRLVAATNADLAALVAAGSFREDLFYRVRVIHVALPPLRERPEDVPELVSHLLARAGAAGREVAPAALERLLSDSWPGNVRALKNCLDRALALAGEGPIGAEHVVLERSPRHGVAPARPVVYAGSIELGERQLSLLEHLRVAGEVSAADHGAREGVSQPTAWRDIADLLAKGVIVKTGLGKKTTYVLAAGWESRLQGG